MANCCTREPVTQTTGGPRAFTFRFSELKASAYQKRKNHQLRHNEEFQTVALLSRITRSLMPHAVPTVPATPCYELSDETMFARGAGRECHRHPDNPGRCIKVARHPEQDNAQEQNLVEWYCATTIQQRQLSFRHCARCYDWVATSRGAGLVVERICNNDGQHAQTMQQYASTANISLSQLGDMINALKSWSLTNGIPIVEISGDNVLVRNQDGHDHFVLVDGIGGRKVKLKMILYRRLPWFGRLRARHRWPPQEMKIREYFSATDQADN